MQVSRLCACEKSSFVFSSKARHCRNAARCTPKGANCILEISQYDSYEPSQTLSSCSVISEDTSCLGAKLLSSFHFCPPVAPAAAAAPPGAEMLAFNNISCCSISLRENTCLFLLRGSFPRQSFLQHMLIPKHPRPPSIRFHHKWLSPCHIVP